MSNQCIGSVQAVEFFESLRPRIKDAELDYYEKAMNRIRYEAGKEIGVKKRVIKGVRSWHRDTKVCGNCGFGANEPHYHYCPDCGTAYLDNSYTEKQLEKKNIRPQAWIDDNQTGQPSDETV